MESVSYAYTLFKCAVESDTARNYKKSLDYYREGIGLLVAASRDIKDEAISLKLMQKSEEYMNRAEKIKKHIEESDKIFPLHEKIEIHDNAKGYSYDDVFSKYLDDSVHRIEIEDPYIQSFHQCENFLRFVELSVRLCPNLKSIFLSTKPDNNASEYVLQKERLNTIIQSMNETGAAQLTIEYLHALHDREIRLDNGWVVKIGYGLDYFKSTNRFKLGFSDFHFRPCKATNIDIVYKKELHVCH